MLYDQHCHSRYSNDSCEDLKNYAIIAEKYHASYVVTTEHIEFNSVCTNSDWTVDFKGLLDEQVRLKEQFPSISFLLGVEIGYRHEYIDKMKKTIASNDFDVVNMSIHDNGVYDYYMKAPFIKLGISEVLNIYFNNIINALDNFNDFDVLSHFDYGFKTAYLIDNTISINDFESIVRTIFKKLIKMNKALEINMKVQNVIDDSRHLKTILRWYKEEGGIDLTLSSDAHAKDAYIRYYEDQKKFIEIIKDAGFKRLNYFIKRKKYYYDI